MCGFFWFLKQYCTCNTIVLTSVYDLNYNGATADVCCWTASVACCTTTGASNQPVTFESNWIGIVWFEFESALEASQVPKLKSVSKFSISRRSQIIEDTVEPSCLLENSISKRARRRNVIQIVRPSWELNP